jgi:hypothetical protein
LDAQICSAVLGVAAALLLSLASSSFLGGGVGRLGKAALTISSVGPADVAMRAAGATYVSIRALSMPAALVLMSAQAALLGAKVVMLCSVEH